MKLTPLNNASKVSVDVIAHADGASAITFPATVAMYAYTVDVGRGCLIEATIAAADTWERLTFVFPADATAAFNIDNTYGVRFGLGLMAGTSRQVTAGSWFSAATNAAGTGNTENWADVVNNYIGITKVKVEVGSAATTYEHENLSVALTKCQRYYEQWEDPGANDGMIAHGNQYTTAYAKVIMPYVVTKRIVPTIGLTAVGTFDLFENNVDHNCTAMSIANGNSTIALMIDVAAGTGLTPGRAVMWKRDTTDTTKITISAEL